MALRWARDPLLRSLRRNFSQNWSLTERVRWCNSKQHRASSTSATSKWLMNGLLSFPTVGRNRDFTAELAADYQLHK